MLSWLEHDAPNIFVITGLESAPEPVCRALLEVLNLWSSTKNPNQPFMAVAVGVTADFDLPIPALSEDFTAIFGVHFRRDYPPVTQDSLLTDQDLRPDEDDPASNQEPCVTELLFGPTTCVMSRDELVISRGASLRRPVDKALEDDVDLLLNGSSLAWRITTAMMSRRTALLGLARAHCFCNGRDAVTTADIDAVVAYV
jgi:hypothetical protein